MTEPIAVALIGYGYVGETFHAPLIIATAGLRLAVIGSSRPDKVRSRYPDVRVIGDPVAAATDNAVDLVVIATPNETHTPLARAALSAGKHVVVDKPFTLDAAEARDLIALAERHDRLLSVFHNRRWDSDFLTVRAAINAGMLGEIVAIESRIDRWRPQVRDRWRESTGAGSGILYDLGPHLIDQMLCLFGLPDSIAAQTARQRPGAVADDWFQLTLRWGERVATLSASMLVAGGTSRWLVHGSRATLEKRCIDIQEDQLKGGIVPGTAGWGVDPDDMLLWTVGRDAAARAAGQGDYRCYYKAVVTALAGGGANPVPASQALATVTILDAARRSASSGCGQRFGWRENDRAAWFV